MNPIIQFCLCSRVRLGVDVTQYILEFLRPNQKQILEMMFKEYGGLHCECKKNYYHSPNHFIDIKNFGEFDNSLHVDKNGRLVKLIIDHWHECCGDWDDVMCFNRSDDHSYPRNCRLFDSICLLPMLEEISIQSVNFSEETTIPEDIWKLKKLKVLKLSHTHVMEDDNKRGITGRIPVGLKYLNLKIINFSWLNLNCTDISPILEIETLEELDIYYIFEGDLHCDITNLDFSKLKNLRKIILEGSLSGVIPESLCNLPNLESVIIMEKHIEGVIPESIFTMPKINCLHISTNASLNFSGDLEYKNIEHIEIFRCGGKPLQVTGNVPEMYGSFDTPENELVRMEDVL